MWPGSGPPFCWEKASVSMTLSVCILETKAELVLSSPLDVIKDPVYAQFDLTHALDTENHRSDCLAIEFAVLIRTCKT